MKNHHFEILTAIVTHSEDELGDPPTVFTGLEAHTLNLEIESFISEQNDLGINYGEWTVFRYTDGKLVSTEKVH